MVALLVLPVVGCAPKAPPPPPPPPPAGTLTVDPAKIDVETLKKYMPAIAKALGLTEAAAATLPPSLAVLAMTVKFTGAGWQPNEVIIIDLVVPPDVEMKGLDRERGEDSVGIAFATANADGNFEAVLERTAKVSWLMRGGFTPTLALDPKTLGKQLPNGTYTLKAMGEDTRAVATATWVLEMTPPPAPPPPAAPPGAPPAAGKLSFEAAEYTNAELGFSLKYPKDWKENKAEIKGDIVHYAVATAQVPALSVGIKGEATFVDALNASLTVAGGSDIKVGAEKETTLADGIKATVAKVDWTVKGYPGETYALGVNKANKWILVTITTVSMLFPYNEALFSEVAHTLQFK
jgi:hypothetical protein